VQSFQINSDSNQLTAQSNANNLITLSNKASQQNEAKSVQRKLSLQFLNRARAPNELQMLRASRTKPLYQNIQQSLTQNTPFNTPQMFQSLQTLGSSKLIFQTISIILIYFKSIYCIFIYITCLINNKHILTLSNREPNIFKK
jgi:hypothetical protein